jgi:hypothetical protein
MIDFNKPQIINLKKPATILKKERTGKYIDDSSFLQEQFFNYETFESEGETCIIFLTKLKKISNENKLITEHIYKPD